MTRHDILCIGSVLWDMIGRAPVHLRQGADVAGRITRLPGGVAMNIAMTLARFGLRPAVLSSIGRDTQGEDLIRAAGVLGVDCTFAYRSDDLPTDRYMAIEGANGLIAAIADAHSLESAGDKILRPLADGRLGTRDAPWSGLVALDGNLTSALLAEIAGSALFARADLRVASAGPGKAERLSPFLPVPQVTLYLNLEEASILCQRDFVSAGDAAQGLLDRGARRVLVTDGARTTADGAPEGVVTSEPPPVTVTRVTGAGDTFMAAHIAAERQGAPRATALATALQAAARYVSGEMTA